MGRNGRNFQREIETEGGLHRYVTLTVLDGKNTLSRCNTWLRQIKGSVFNARLLWQHFRQRQGKTLDVCATPGAMEGLCGRFYAETFCRKQHQDEFDQTLSWGNVRTDALVRNVKVENHCRCEHSSGIEKVEIPAFEPCWLKLSGKRNR